MVAASLVVIAVIAGLLFAQQRETREQRLREQGASLVRVLAKMPRSQLAPTQGSGPLQLLRHADESELSYAALVDVEGRTLAEVTAPGVFLPSAPLPESPAAWLGERRLADGPSGREILARCDGSRSVEAVAAALRARHPGDEGIERDVYDFVERMEGLGVLQLGAGALEK